MKPVLVGIGGPSCAGKSELARHLMSALAAQVLALDRYYRDLSHLGLEERAQWNFDVPEALDADQIARDLAMLAAGQAIEVPIYDFAQHVRRPERHRVEPTPYLIVEGLFTLYWEAVRRWLHLKLFVGAPDEVCLVRRLERDVRERGRTPESVRRQYERTVRPMAEKYILPTRGYADLVLDGTAPPDRLLDQVLAELARRGLHPRGA
ncbi:MAG: uridine kinase [Bryobacterales bacterium]|nr:uridine kinase [Bryobacteraceae bacterium]MDW8129683.1 uridine kinase [Bryobacterales bacterium]